MISNRVVSFSERKKFEDLIDFFDNFYQHFIKSTEQTYPFLTRKSIWNYVFSGVINAEGEEKGIEILQQYIEELEKLDKQSEFAKKWNETTIKERKQEVQVIDKILKNLIRFNLLVIGKLVPNLLIFFE